MPIYFRSYLIRFSTQKSAPISKRARNTGRKKPTNGLKYFSRHLGVDSPSIKSLFREELRRISNAG